MSSKWKYKTTLEYKIKSYGLVFLIWVAFNLFSGLISGNMDFPDNYFVLSILVLISAFRCSYAVSYSNGQINTFQLGMITGNIDLYKVKEVKEEKGVLKIYGEDDAQFSIAYQRLPKDSHREILSSIKPFYGEEPIIVAAPTGKVFTEKAIKKYNQSIFGGIVLAVVAIIGIFTDIIYLPGRHGPIHRSDGDDQFFFLLGLCVVLGIVSLAYGTLGKIRSKSA